MSVPASPLPRHENMASQKMGLSRLSSDLLSMLMGFILRPKDLVSICQTCKRLYEPALRELYYEVELDLGGPRDSMLTAMLNPRNPGLQYVRLVNLYKTASLPLSDDRQNTQQAELMARMLLEMLPKDSLEEFRWHPWDPFPTENMILLFKTQRRLKQIEGIAIEKTLDEGLKKKFDFENMSIDNVTSIGLYPDSKNTLELCHELVKRKQELESLSIITKFNVDPDSDGDTDNEELPTDLDDTILRPGRVTSTIFKHLLPFDTCTAMKLTELILEHVYLRYAPSTYCKVIEFPRLKELKVIECGAAGALFAALCKSTGLPDHLEVLEVTQSNDGPECELSKALDDFLPLVTGLKELVVELGGVKSLPAVAAITRHGKSLKSLSLHASETVLDSRLHYNSSNAMEEEIIYSSSHFLRLCRACQQLQELSIAFPTTVAFQKLHSQYASCISAVTQYLTGLITLQITTWPSVGSGSSSTSRFPVKNYVHELQLIAQDIFEGEVSDIAAQSPPASPDTDGDAATDAFHLPSNTSGRPRPRRLQLVAFGTSEKYYDRSESTEMAIFARASQTDPLDGRSKVLASQIGWNARRYFEPRSKLLDFPLQRGNKRPVRDSSSDSEDADF